MACCLRVTLETALPSFSELEVIFCLISAETNFVNELSCLLRD